MNRSHLALGLALLAFAGVIACEAAEAPRPAVELSTSRIRLTRETQSFVRSAGPIDVDFANGERSFLFSGWTHDAGPGGAMKAGLWAGRDAASFALPLTLQKPLRIEMIISPVPGLPDGVQFVRSFWNGKQMRDFRISEQDQRVVLPIAPGEQRTGLNILELRPQLWVEAPFLEGSVTKPKSFSVQALKMIRPNAPPPGSVEAVAGGGWRFAGNASLETAFISRPQAALGFSLRRPPPCRSTELVDSQAFFKIVQELESGQKVIRRIPVARIPCKAKPYRVPLKNDASDYTALTFSLRQSKESVLRVELTGSEIEFETQSSPSTSRIPRAPHNVLVVLFDTQRADHLGVYGNVEIQTGATDELARSGVVFERMFANSSWTRPAMSSIYTGLYAETHEILDMERDRMRDNLPFLPETLQERDYRTLLVLNNPTVSAAVGFGRGFDEVNEIFEREDELRAITSPSERAQNVWEKDIAPFLDQDRERPFFAVLHEIDPHAPYEPPPPYDSLYRREPHAGHHRTGPHSMLGSGQMKLRPHDVAHLRAQYKGEVGFMDAYLGKILSLLEDNGIHESTLVVFLSDHGEEFYEHGKLRHGHSLFEEQLRVPLIMRLPGILPAGLRLRDFAEQVDLAPTILDLLGFEIPPNLQGHSLLPGVEGAGSEPNLSFAKLGRSLWSVRHENRKLIRATTSSPEIFSLSLHDVGDGFEGHNLSSLDPIATLALDSELRRHIHDSQEFSRQHGLGKIGSEGTEDLLLDPETRRRLKALGYLE